MMIAGQLEIQLYADVARIKADMERVQSSVSGAMAAMDKSIGVAKSALEGLVAGIAAGASVAAFAKLVKGSIDSAAALNDLSIQTGATVESLSGLAAVGKLSDVSTQQIAHSMNLLAKNMSGATEESRGAGKAIEALGINFDTFKKLSPDEQMQMVAKSMDKFQDGTGKSAVAMALYGKEGAKLLPFLKDLAQTGELQAKVTTEQAAMADNFSDNLVKLSASGDAWKKELSMGLLPALNDLSDAWLSTMNGAGGLRAEVRKLSADGTIDEWARDTANVLTRVMDAGEGVARVFLVIGKTIGASAAQAAALAQGEMRQAIIVGNTWLADMDTLMSKELIGQRLRDSFDKTAKAKTQALTDYQQAVSDVMKAYAGYDLKTQQAAMVALRNAYFGEQKSGLDFTNINGKAASNQVSEYEKLIRTIKEKVAATELELSSDEKLTEGQKLAVKFTTDLRDGVLHLSDAQKIEVSRNLELLIALDKSLDAKSTEKKATLAAAEAHVKYIITLDDGLKKLKEQVAEQEFHNATIGLSKEAIAALEAAKLEDQATTLEGIAIKKLDKDLDEQQYNLYKGQADQLRKLAAAKKDGAAKEADFESWKSLFDSIDRSAHDTWVSIFESGKNAFDRLRDTLKNGLYDLLYQMTLKKWILSIGATVSGVPGIAGAAASGATSSAAGGIGGSIGTVLGGIGTFGAGFSYGATSLFANGLGATLSAGSSMIGAGSIASGLGTIAGALGPIALGVGAVYALVKSLDHSGTIHTGGAASASATDTQSLDARSLGFMQINTSDDAQKMVSGLASSIVGILDSTATTFGKTAGYSAATAFADDTSKDGAWGALVVKKLGDTLIDWDSNRQSRWAPREYADGEAGKNQYLADLSASVRFALNDIGLPGWAQQMLDQLGNAPSLTDLAATVDKINATQTALINMGNAIGGIKNLSDAAVSALISAAGGIDALSSATSTYYDNFYSEAEKAEGTKKAITDVLAAVGVAMPATRAEFRDLVDAELALGAARAPAVAALMKVSGAFASIVEEATTASAAATDNRKVLLGEVDSAMKSLKRSVESQRSAVTAAYDAVVAGLKASIDGVNSRISKLSSLSNSLKSTLDGMRLPQQFGMDLASAKAQIQTALTLARTGGVFPDSEALASALSIISQPTEQLYATFVDYQREFQIQKNNISELAGLTDTQLSVEQRTLNSMNDQLEVAKLGYEMEMSRLDGILTSAQTQVDKLNGIETAILGLPEAITNFNKASQAAGGGTIAGTATAAGVAAGMSTGAFFSDVSSYGDKYGSEAYYLIPGINDYASKLANNQEIARLTGSSLEDVFAMGGHSQAYWEEVQRQFDSGMHPTTTSIQGFAVGTGYVPYDMTARIHAGEEITPRPYVDMQRQDRERTNQLLSELIDENAKLRAMTESHLYAIAKHSMRAADTLDESANGQRPLQTAEAV